MYAEKVKKGAAWLDAKAPGWVDKVDLKEFDMSTYGECTLGQTFGEMTSKSLCADHPFSEEHGFSIDDVIGAKRSFFGFGPVVPVRMSKSDRDTEYRKLSAAWIHEILERRAKKVA